MTARLVIAYYSSLLNYQVHSMYITFLALVPSKNMKYSPHPSTHQHQNFQSVSRLGAYPNSCRRNHEIWLPRVPQAVRVLCVGAVPCLSLSCAYIFIWLIQRCLKRSLELDPREMYACILSLHSPSLCINKTKDVNIYHVYSQICQKVQCMPGGLIKRMQKLDCWN